MVNTITILLYVIVLNLRIATATALISGIVYPLYIDPGGSSCTAWQPLITAAAAQPDLSFYVIVNPDSGPGSATPNVGYQTCIPSLRASNPNVKVIGYVATGNGTSRTQAVVEGDVDLYAVWGSTYRPDGIFFDEASSSSTEFSKYQNYSAYAEMKTWFTPGKSFVTLNPGQTPDAIYYTIADLIVSFENAYPTFQITDLTISSASPATKQAVILHTAPSGSHATIIDELIANQVGAIFITNLVDDASTNFNPYTGFPVDWTDFVNAVANAQ